MYIHKLHTYIYIYVLGLYIYIYIDLKLYRTYYTRQIMNIRANKLPGDFSVRRYVRTNEGTGMPASEQRP